MNKTIIASVIATMSIVGTGVSQACTTAAYHNGDTSISARTMDWAGNDEAIVVGTGAGMLNSYSDNDGLQTTSKYAALKIESFNPGIVAEAMNEQGLEVHLLYLGISAGTEFQADTADFQNVDATNVPRFLVDNFANVDEAIAGLKGVDVIGTEVYNLEGHEGESIKPPVHFQINDKHGNSAVVEYIAGEMKIYQVDGAAYMSNDPTFDYHLTQDAEKVEANSSIRATDRRLRAKAQVQDMYTRNVQGEQAAIAIKAVGATAFSGTDRMDPYVGDGTAVFPTLWTNYTDRNAGTWKLDRHDTWAVEEYSMADFDTQKAERVVLGAHPSYRGTATN
ncbi:linear amide C-N hydrolase [Alginatibacterium sediminis]|uniref:Linear amide C-N hydrolase n=1 Tax=Alginatibacterium sediminis TaxID=2164068 RepID=A0A420EDM5_9ALTE|nr:linear amide C-N hydrolase [Alginatibacterium sediminis]RKF18770.1 linear amide C-N hydrolase [Alginatibacterium sediminis]